MPSVVYMRMNLQNNYANNYANINQTIKSQDTIKKIPSLRGSMISRVYNQKPGCSSCGKK